MIRKDKGKSGIYLINAFLYLAHFSEILLRLNSISLVQFKNYLERTVSFPSAVEGISGPNGVGKTNLLDAIYYLCFTKSYFGRNDAQHVHYKTSGFRIEGQFELNGQPLSVVCILRDNGKKEFLLNGELYEKLSHHVGKLPCVIVAPDDVRIITEGSEERRRFMDAILSQTDPEYLQRLIQYNRVLQQRNSHLKSVATKKSRDLLLDVYDEQLAEDGRFIFEKRTAFCRDSLPLVTGFYRQISGRQEAIGMEYTSQLQHLSFPELFRMMREKDLLLQRTNGGTHKDDLSIQLDDQPFKNTASQGQRKSLLFALKLAEFEILKRDKGFAPLLLLDDVFEKLDEARMHNLLEWVCLQNDGQIFITDTHSDRIAAHLGRLGVRFGLINL